MSCFGHAAVVPVKTLNVMLNLGIKFGLNGYCDNIFFTVVKFAILQLPHDLVFSPGRTQQEVLAITRSCY